MHLCVDEAVEEEVAGEAGVVVGFWGIQKDVGVQTCFAGGDGGAAAVVGLDAAAGDGGVAVGGKGVGKEEVEFADFVAGEGDAGEVIAFDPEVDGVREDVGEGLDGSGNACEVETCRGDDVERAEFCWWLICDCFHRCVIHVYGCDINDIRVSVVWEVRGGAKDLGCCFFAVMLVVVMAWDMSLSWVQVAFGEEISAELYAVCFVPAYSADTSPAKQAAPRIQRKLRR